MIRYVTFLFVVVMMFFICFLGCALGNAWI